jgi:hypothetical protein
VKSYRSGESGGSPLPAPGRQLNGPRLEGRALGLVEGTVDPGLFRPPAVVSSSFLILCPSTDQPGTGGNVRGITGSSWSTHRMVTPVGGWILSLPY